MGSIVVKYMLCVCVYVLQPHFVLSSSFNYFQAQIVFKQQ